ncbi:hypothetical protein ACFTSE_23810 [Bacillus cereus]|uniref:hypothetical protein n=1 Tax=Bacillus cereus TaxID=1396 RepID=UPI003629406F
MLGNAVQLAGCLLPFILLFNLDRFFKAKKYVSMHKRINGLIALSNQAKKGIINHREIKLTKYEAAWYGALSALYITIGYILATAELDWRINTIWIRLLIFALITIVLVYFASFICSIATKKYVNELDDK